MKYYDVIVTVEKYVLVGAENEEAAIEAAVEKFGCGWNRAKAEVEYCCGDDADDHTAEMVDNAKLCHDYLEAPAT